MFKILRSKVFNPLIEIVYGSLADYPAPNNLTYFWNFGIYAFVCLIIQIITGIALAMHYVPHIDYAFFSVEHIMRDVNYGWLIRYIHANGASMFFVVVYIHTFRGIYYGSYIHPRESLWIVGVIILLLMIITAFMGYVLPWGQMSFWGATVITSLASAIPFFGTMIVEWLWGGFSVDNPTLNRFYSLHFFFPFVILALVLIHIFLLHNSGSNNPLGANFGSDGGMTFSPYYLLKDLNGLVLFLAFFALFLYYAPNVLAHPDNYARANSLVTPTHIVPEWYFLPWYAILRSIPDKYAGVVAMLTAILCLFAIPFIHYPRQRSMRYRLASKIFFWLFVIDCVILGFIGSKPIEYPYLYIGQICTAFYFAYFAIITPLCIWWENRHFLGVNKNQLDR